MKLFDETSSLGTICSNKIRNAFPCYSELYWDFIESLYWHNFFLKKAIKKKTEKKV